MIEIESHKIDKISSSHSGLTAVKPSDKVSYVISLMKINDFSQIPVMSSKHNLKGYVNWKILGLSSSKINDETLVEDIMETRFNYAYLNDSVIDVLDQLKNSEDDFVFIKNNHELWSGIVTSHDIVNKYSDLINPLIAIEKIEKKLRQMITKMPSYDIQAINTKFGLSLNSMDDAVFSDYRKILSNEASFSESPINIDKKVFIKTLKDINEIRNKFFHFRVEGLSEEEIRKLNKLVDFLDSI